MDSGELSFDGGSDYAKQMAAVKKIISVVAKDSVSEVIKRLARLSRDAMTCMRRGGESIASYVERFSTQALAFLNLTSCDKSYGESQNLAVAMVANAKLPNTTHTAVISTLVSAAKNRKKLGT